MYQNFSRSVGYGNRGYGVLIKNLKSVKNTILISGANSDYNYALNKLSRIFKKKPKHILLKKNRENINFLEGIYKKNKEKIDTIVALGGGSIIDFSKRLVLKFRKNKKINFYVIPTLLGSGAESSISSIINSGLEKNIIVNENFLPDAIIYDENFFKTISKLNLLMGVMDSFSHCVESLTSINKNYYLNFLSIEAINSFIKKNTINALINKNKFNYYDIASLSFNGGLAQSNAGSGICHALTHSLEKILNIRHIEGISFFIKPVIKYLLIKNKKDLNGFDHKLYKYISSLSKYIVNNKNFEEIEKLIENKSFVNNLIEKSKNDICWNLYNKNIDINLLINCLKK